MKVSKHKCPNCGAPLKVEPGKSEVTCNYCRETFTLEKEASDIINEHLENVTVNAEEIQKNARSIAGVIMIVTFVMFFIIIGSFVLVSSKIKGGHGIFSSNKVATSLSSIEELDLDDFNKESIEKLNSYKGNLSSDYEVSDWKYYGLYFLKSSNRNQNKLLGIYERTYIYDGNENKIYAVVSYENVSINKKKLVFKDGVAKVKSIQLKGDNLIYGYSNMNQLYIDVIFLDSVGYEIEATNGLYMR